MAMALVPFDDVPPRDNDCRDAYQLEPQEWSLITITWRFVFADKKLQCAGRFVLVDGSGIEKILERKSVARFIRSISLPSSRATRRRTKAPRNTDTLVCSGKSHERMDTAILDSFDRI
jgi:hypothetical protein